MTLSPKIRKIYLALFIAMVIFVQLTVPIFSAHAAICVGGVGGASVPVCTVAGSMTATDLPGPGLGNLSMNTIKSYILNLAAKIAMTVLIRALTNQIISWIQGNNGTNVGFVQNIEQATLQEADAAGGAFLNDLTGIDLCTVNLRQFLQISLRTPALKRQLGCTLSSIGANADRFFQNFQNGGWPAFIKIGMEPQNNPYGAYLIALDAKVAAETRAAQAIGAKVQAGKGFIGFTVDRDANCRSVSEDEAHAAQTVQGFGGRTKQHVVSNQDEETGQTDNQICDVVQDIKTPGNLVADSLTKAFGSGIDFAVASQEIAGAITSIVTALIQKIITSSSGVIGGNGQGNSNQGIFTPEVGNIQFSQSDAQNSALQQRVSGFIFSADAVLTSLNQAIIENQRNLFSARAAVSTITNQIAALQNQPPSADRDRQIQTLQTQLATAQQSTAELETKLNTQLSQQATMIASETELMRIKRAFVFATNPQEIVDATSSLEPAIARLSEIASQVSATFQPVPATGDSKRDAGAMLSNAETNVRNEITLFTAMKNEIERQLSLAGTPPQRINLLAQKRSDADAEIARLNEQLTALLNLDSRLASAVTDDQIRVVSQDAVSRIIIADGELAAANSTMTAIMQILKP